MGLRVPNAPRKGGRHNVHYNNYDLPDRQDTNGKTSIMWGAFPSAGGTPTHWCCLALQSLHVAQGGNDSNIG